MIVITAPTSRIGHQVLGSILDSGEPVRVIARDPSRLPAQARERAEIVQGSHSDEEVVRQAFAGADAVFWLVPPIFRAESAEAAYPDFARPACEALQSLDVKHVVGISVLGRGWPRNAGTISAQLAMSDMVAATGASYRALTCPGFMDNVLRQAERIKTQGVMSWPADGNLKAPICATRDIAASATRLLLDRSWSGVGDLPILGPEDLSPNELAQIISEVLERPVRFEELPLDAFQAQLIGSGLSEGMAQAMGVMMAEKNKGMDNLEPRTPESTTPTSFRQWCEAVLKPAIQAS